MTPSPSSSSRAMPRLTGDIVQTTGPRLQYVVLLNPDGSVERVVGAVHSRQPWVLERVR